MKTLLMIAKSKLTCQKGQGTVEYAILTVAVIAVLAAVLFTGAAGPLGTAITDAFAKISTAITAVPTS